MYKNNAASKYQTVNIETTVMNASPHKLIEMLLDGALKKINLAKGFIKCKNIEAKGESISAAIAIVGGLQQSLDLDSGEEVATNLFMLYDYMNVKLVEANTLNDIDILNEVAKLIIEIKSGWDQIPEEYKKPSKS